MYTNRFLCFFCFAFTLLSQSKLDYLKLCADASAYYTQKEYRKSAELYARAFALLGEESRSTDIYDAACSWALATETDSAFALLFRLKNYSNYRHLSADKDLETLHSDSRWARLVSGIKANYENSLAKRDSQLVAILSDVYQSDQSIRIRKNQIATEFGWESKEMRENDREMLRIDSINMAIVAELIKQHGWPDRDVIGYQGSLTLFLTIQHCSDVRIQQRYLPMIRQAVADGKLDASLLAILEDRIALRTGQLQIYGSQLYRDPKTEQFYVRPLIDPDRVDFRRAEVWLAPLQEYLNQWQVKWDSETYKQKLPAYIEYEREIIRKE
ncbi:MAG: hypothetical protein KDD94_07930 [Calditrichaeota bacterium]|nr:hypothetical protein [Calditrichota bacterium]